MGRYLLVVQRLLPGGTETHVLTLAKALAKVGHRVGVFTSGGPWVPLFKSSGVHVHEHASFLSGNTPASRDLLRHTVATHRYRVVHAHDGAGFRLLSATPLVARKVITVHGLYAARRDVRVAGRAAHSVIAVSPMVKSYVVKGCGVSETKVKLIPNGVSMGLFRPYHDTRLRRELDIPANAVVIGYAGRFTLGKGRVSRWAATALAEYAKQHQHVHVVIAGRMSKESIGTNPGTRVHVLGAMQNMPKFYHACDAVVGTARVALESMACEIPTIAVGESRYVGRITPHNLVRAYHTNFGDHGRQHPLARPQLFADLDFVRHHPNTSRDHARRVRVVIGRHFSNYHMVARTRAVYE